MLVNSLKTKIVLNWGGKHSLYHAVNTRRLVYKKIIMLM
jgi:hypothetical protein